MTLQNRVRPDGAIVADPARGLFMGNRGGRIHDPATRTLTGRGWASRRWICCVTDFRGRRRSVMGRGYTELFFLDEATALAAGHRPCFECRRADATRFAALWAEGHGLDRPPSADEMDLALHADRVVSRRAPHKELSAAEAEGLPSGAMVAADATPEAGPSFLLRHGGDWLSWSHRGYRPRTLPKAPLRLLTPDCLLPVLRAGYTPVLAPIQDDSPPGRDEGADGPVT